ncbi:class F sortase [Streptomyces sp. NPDC001691]|uniref:class F sortase n=1 Tax=Streptomyces sp. NPDC001691 TaxID=3364600 RepID=UPI00369F899F
MSRTRAARSAAAALFVLALGVSAVGCGSDSARPTPPPTVSAASSAPAAKAPAALPASKPVRVEIPAAGVDVSPILDLGLADDGTVEVPSVADADRIGWYDKGVTPGQTGPAVLIGHFDTVKGPAVLKNVSKVRVGDVVSVVRADGKTAKFTVRALEQVDKKTFPTQKVYGNTDRPELRIITCGGELTGGHRPDNIILYADLVA